MKRFLILLAVCVFCQVSAFAQDAPKAEVFGGFSALTFKPNGVAERTTPLGWQASAEVRMWKFVGAVADFGGHYKKPIGSTATFHFYEYLGGVRAHVRRSKLDAFGHALWGGATGGGGGISNTQFTVGYGGGADWSVNDNWAIRLAQVDWIPTRSNGTWEKNQFRFGFGLVWKVAS
jgi:opacity protein-like surface antigen